MFTCLELAVKVMYVLLVKPHILWAIYLYKTRALKVWHSVLYANWVSFDLVF